MTVIQCFNHNLLLKIRKTSLILIQNSRFRSFWTFKAPAFPITNILKKCNIPENSFFYLKSFKKKKLNSEKGNMYEIWEFLV